MGISIKEKEHWKERIERKIQQRIDRLIADKSPDFLRKVALDAKNEARRKLGLLENYDSRRKLECAVAELDSTYRSQRAPFERDIKKLQDEEAASILKISVNAVSWNDRELADLELCRLAKPYENQIMSRDETGRNILNLQKEQEQMLDTVWLATSPKQIRDLWASTTELLQSESTELQAAALLTEPLEE